MNRLALLCVMLAALSLSGCKVAEPGRFESKTVNYAKHHVTVRGKSKKNPLLDNAENREAGQQAFGHYCAACHGLDGQNTGVPFAGKMSPPIPLLTSTETQKYTDGQLKWVIDNGLRPSGMPASRGTLSDDEIWSIVVFLRHLPPAGSQGEPEMHTH